MATNYPFLVIKHNTYAIYYVVTSYNYILCGYIL